MEKSKLSGFIDTEYSSGDSKMMHSKQKHKEENNNELDELSKEFSEMGCIVDPAKRPSNICVENYIYEESSEDEGQHENENENGNEDAEGYSDEFEDEKSEDEELKLEPESAQSESGSKIQSESVVKLIKSQSSMSSKPGSVSGRSTGGGSTIRPRRRINMSFSNDRVREIERHNHILLSKILTARNERKSSIPTHDHSTEPRKQPLPAAAVQRRQLQKKIDHDNMILLKKIQRAKSSTCSLRR